MQIRLGEMIFSAVITIVMDNQGTLNEWARLLRFNASNIFFAIIIFFTFTVLVELAYRLYCFVRDTIKRDKNTDILVEYFHKKVVNEFICAISFWKKFKECQDRDIGNGNQDNAKTLFLHESIYYFEKAISSINSKNIIESQTAPHRLRPTGFSEEYLCFIKRLNPQFAHDILTYSNKCVGEMCDLAKGNPEVFCPDVVDKIADLKKRLGTMLCQIRKARSCLPAPQVQEQERGSTTAPPM